MIFLPESLTTSFPTDCKTIVSVLETHHIPYRFLPGTKDIWLRDFMPVRTKSGKLVCFRYDPYYLKGYKHLRTNYKDDIAPHLNLPVEYSDINLDGGNVVFSPSRSKVIISDRIFSENPKCAPKELEQKLSDLLEAEVIIIPALPKGKDMTGHADGMVRFVAEDQVIVNEIDKDDQALTDALARHGVKIVDSLPYSDPKKADSAVGCYLNYLEVGNLILLPVFGVNVEMDQQAVEKAKAVFQGRTIVPVLIHDIAKEGGCLNCISWELP